MTAVRIDDSNRSITYSKYWNRDGSSGEYLKSVLIIFEINA